MTIELTAFGILFERSHPGVLKTAIQINHHFHNLINPHIVTLMRLAKNKILKLKPTLILLENFHN